MYGRRVTEYITDVNGARSLPWQSNRGNNERFKRLLYSSYKMSLERDIAQLLNETSGLQESNLVAEVLVDCFCNSDEGK